MNRLRSALDRLYDGAGRAAAVCMVAMLGVIVAQMVTRWMSVPFPGSSEYAGYLMAASAFLAFAHALNAGAHIRVGLLLSALGRYRRVGEAWCLAVGSAVAAYIAFYAVRLVYWSFLLNDISQGQDETALWIVQVPFAAGAVLLAVCFVDNLAALAVGGRDNIRPATDGPPVE